MGNKLSAPLPSLIGLSDDDIVDGICDDPFFLGLEDLAEELFPDDDNRARKRIARIIVAIKLWRIPWHCKINVY